VGGLADQVDVVAVGFLGGLEGSSLGGAGVDFSSVDPENGVGAGGTGVVRFQVVAH